MADFLPRPHKRGEIDFGTNSFPNGRLECSSGSLHQVCGSLFSFAVLILISPSAPHFLIFACSLEQLWRHLSSCPSARAECLSEWPGLISMDDKNACEKPCSLASV